MKELKDNKSSLIIEIIDAEDEREDDKIQSALGISVEREKALEKIIRIAYSSTDTVTDAVVLISKECKHANELFWVSFRIGQIKTEHSIKGGIAIPMSALRGEGPEGLIEMLKKAIDLREPKGRSYR